MILQLFPFLQTNPYIDSYNTGPSTGIIIIYLILAVIAIAGMWKAFEKAGHPGWAAIIPFYNIYILTKIGGKPGWWVLLFLIPLVNIIIAIILYIEVAKRFGKGAGFGVGLALLGFIFWPILGFGDAQYIGDGSLRTDVDNIGRNY